MTRLQSHRQKQTTKKIIIMILLAVGLLYAFFQIGLKSAINSAVFVNNIAGENTSESTETKEADFYGILNVDEPEVATNEATIIITGDATEYEKVEYFLNNVRVETGNISSTGTFKEEIGKLKVGENKIYVLAKDKSGKHKKESDSFTVNYINKKPTLEIETPKDNDKVSKNEIQIKGKTDKNINLKVNFQPIVIGIDGSFTSSYRLKEGENKLEFIATDIAGNEEKKTLTIRYEKDE